jgi:arylsulfatase A-like enzyme
MKVGWKLDALIAASGLLAGCGHSEQAVGAAPPVAGIVFISVDTLRADRLNCYGYTRRRTSPHMDALARDGIRFASHVSASPWTTPSHMSMFTALNPSEHGVSGMARTVNNRLKLGEGYPVLPAEVPTLPEILKKAGWSTAAFTGGRTVDPRLGFGRGFDVYDTSMHKVSPKRERRIKEWVRAHARSRFFLFWHTFEVHAPYTRTDFLDEVLPSEAAARIREEIHARVESKRGRKLVEEGIEVLARNGAYNAGVADALYDGGIVHFDQALGDLVADLKAQGLYDRTVIALTSDHGEQLGERDGQFYNAHGHTNYEEQVRVPLIVKLPGQRAAGREVRAVTRAVDLLPTLLELAGSPGPVPGHGASLRPLWDGQEGGDRREAISEHTNGEYEIKSLRTGRLKFIVSGSEEDLLQHGRVVPPKPRRRELYDLAADPGEAKDLLQERKAQVEDLADRMEARLRLVTAHGAHAGASIAVDKELLEGLQGLGYVK